VLGQRTPETGAGIVSFRKQGVESAEIVRHLWERGIATAARGGWVRTAPHFYISADEIDQMLAELG
jgi:selenocysteine lyase/cysteine desulfurase